MREPKINSPATLVVALATCANILGYMDRVCISIVAPQLRTEFRFTEPEIGFIFGAFSLSYALFQTPWGMLADRRGVRHLIAAVILLWSLFTGLTALVWSFWSMLVVRFSFGVSEAALSPAVASAFRRRVSSVHRSTAFGLFLAGGRVGGMAAPVVATYFVLRHGWRSVFFALAAGGLLMFLAWWIGFPRDRHFTPEPAQAMRPASLVLSLPLAALVTVATLYTMTWQFYATWFPTYLMQNRGFSLQRAGSYTSLAFLFGLIGTAVGGIAGDASVRWFGVRSGRRLIVSGGLLLCSLCLYAGVSISNAELGSLVIALAAGAGDLVLAAIWATAVDLGGAAAGFVSGLMNCISNLGGFVSPVAIGWMLQAHASWAAILMAAALCNVVAVLLWLFVDPAKIAGMPKVLKCVASE